MKKLKEKAQQYLTLAVERLQYYQDKAEPSLSIKEQMLFAKRLAFLARAGVPILESLHMMSEQGAKKREARIVRSVVGDISEGQTLASALSRFPRVFGDFTINIVRIGEASGSLSDNLEYLAHELKKREDLKNKVISAFIYPAVITVATLLITGFLMLYLFPKLMPIFNSLKMELPLTTKIVIAISQFLVQWWVLVLAVMIASIVAVIVLRIYHPGFRYFFDRALLTIPFVNTLIRTFNLSVDMRTLGILLQSGTPILEAITLTGRASHSEVYKKHYRALEEAIKSGEQLSTYFGKHPKDYPTLLAQMIKVGERSGNLSNTLLYLANMYEIEMDDYTRNLSSLIEPALMVVMGLVVGLIAVSIITPIYGITEHLKP